VLSHDALGAVGIPALNRVEDGPMLLVALPDGRRVDLQLEQQAAAPLAAVEGVDHLQQVDEGRISRRLVDDRMKVPDGIEDLADRFRIGTAVLTVPRQLAAQQFGAIQRRAHLRQLCLGRLLGSQASPERAQRILDHGDLAQLFLGVVRDPNRSRTSALDQPILLQPAQRLAYGGRTYAQRLGETAFCHLLSPSERASDDRLTDRYVGLIAQGRRRKLRQLRHMPYVTCYSVAGQTPSSRAGIAARGTGVRSQVATIVISQPVHAAEVDRLRADHEVVELAGARGLSSAELVSACSHAEVLICQLTDDVAAPVFRSPRLRLVAAVAAGVDNIDLRAAAESGIAVTHTPGVLTEASADLAIALMLAVARHIVAADADVRGGNTRDWRLLHEPMGTDISGATLGIIGMGRIGEAVARRARLGFGMTILYCSRSRHPAAEADYGAARVTLGELLSNADVVSLHAPLTPETKHVINATTLELMRPHAILVNTARGALVNEADLAAGLRSGQLAGAALDVFEDEPRVHPDLLATGNRVVLTPHIGSATAKTRLAMTRTAVDDVLAVLAGRRPKFPVPGTLVPS
jgi:glyoxylate reductase